MPGRYAPYEMMLSESQERMLIILEDGKEKLKKYLINDLDFIIGKTTNTNKLFYLIIKLRAIEALDLAPIYSRKWIKKKPRKNTMN